MARGRRLELGLEHRLGGGLAILDVQRHARARQQLREAVALLRRVEVEALQGAGRRGGRLVLLPKLDGAPALAGTWEVAG